MFFRDIMHDNKGEAKQFKSATGSPILYTKFKKHRGIYYPLAKHHANMKGTPKKKGKHVCVVYSKLYGREMYANVDIWPDDEAAQKRLLKKLQTMSIDDDLSDDDFGIDMSKGVEDMSDHVNSGSETNDR